MKSIVLVCFLVLLAGVWCGDGPSARDILKGYGLKVDMRTVVTEDNYTLMMLRARPNGTSNGVFFFQHGLVDSDIGIVLNPYSYNLVWLLANKLNVTVILGNNRGNGVSMGNRNYSIDTPQFWNFTFDEMARYDVPAQIEEALRWTGADKLIYAGHSEGTTQMFAALTENATIANYLSAFIALAPVARVGNQKALLLSILAELDAEKIVQLFDDQEFALDSAIQKLLPAICKVDPEVCEFSLNAMMGPSTNVSPDRMPFIMSEEPCPTSVLNIVHWAQAVRTGLFCKYDYGSANLNILAYGQSTPPLYDLSQYPKTLPTYLMVGTEDYLADPSDVEWLESQLNGAKYAVFSYPYSHTDFLWAEDAYSGQNSLYADIISIVNSHL